MKKVKSCKICYCCATPEIRNFFMFCIASKMLIFIPKPLYGLFLKSTSVPNHQFIENGVGAFIAMKNKEFSSWFDQEKCKVGNTESKSPFKYSFVYVSHTSQLLGDRLIHVCTSVAQQKISYLPFVLAQLLRTASNQRFSVSAVSKVPASTCPTQFWVNSCQSNNRNSDWNKKYLFVSLHVKIVVK